MVILETRTFAYPRHRRDPDVPEEPAAGSHVLGDLSVTVAPMLREGPAPSARSVRSAATSRRVHRQGDRAAQDLRRPGGDRDPERAPVQRDEEALEQQTRVGRGARGIASSIADTHAGVRQDPRELRAAVRRHASASTCVGDDGTDATSAPTAAAAGTSSSAAVPRAARARHGDRHARSSSARVLHYPGRRRRPRRAAAGARHARRIVGYRVHASSRRCCGRARHRRASASAATTPGAVLRQGDRAAEDLRRPGGDRDPERAPVPRDPGQEPRSSRSPTSTSRSSSPTCRTSCARR